MEMYVLSIMDQDTKVTNLKDSMILWNASEHVQFTLKLKKIFINEFK